MSVFETDSRLPFTAGIIAIILAVALAIALIAGAFLGALSFLTFVFVVGALLLIILALWIGWQLVGYVQSSYALDRNAFVIRWGLTREIVPMGDVQRVIAAEDVADGLRLRRLPLPGWWRGVGSHPALGKIHFYSTASIDEQVVVITPERNYSVSPYDAEAFLDAFKARFEMRPTQVVAHSKLTPGVFEWDYWRDRAAQLLLLCAIAINLCTFGLSAARYPSAPAQLPLHFDTTGIVDRFGPRTQLFVPAFIALVLLVINSGLAFVLYAKKERLPAMLLWGGSVAVQLMFFMATVTIGFSSV